MSSQMVHSNQTMAKIRKQKRKVNMKEVVSLVVEVLAPRVLIKQPDIFP